MRCHGSDVHLLPTVIKAQTSILLRAADPGDETDSEGDGIAQTVFLFHFMDHPVESSLTKDGTDKDFLLGLVNVGCKTEEGVAVLMDGHAQDDDVCVGDDVGRIGTLLLDLSMVGLECLPGHILDFASDGVIPIIWAASHEVDIVIRLSKEGNENVGRISSVNREGWKEWREEEW